MRTLLVLMVPFILTGCIADSKHEAAPQNGAGGAVTVNIPPQQTVDTGAQTQALGAKIDSSNTNLQNQMSGLVNGMIDKMYATVKGVEANIKDLIHLQFQMQNTLNSNINTKLEAVATMNTKLDSQVQVNNEMKAQLSSVIEMKNDVKAVAAIKATVDAQVGLLNEIKNTTTTLNAKAGRDVNMLPKEAVDLLTRNLLTCVGIVFLVLAVTCITICLAFSSSRNREAQRTQLEREERNRLFDLLTEALLHVPPEKAVEMRHMMRSVSQVPVNSIKR